MNVNYQTCNKCGMKFTYSDERTNYIHDKHFNAPNQVAPCDEILYKAKCNCGVNEKIHYCKSCDFIWIPIELRKYKCPDCPNRYDAEDRTTFANRFNGFYWINHLNMSHYIHQCGYSIWDLKCFCNYDKEHHICIRCNEVVANQAHPRWRILNGAN